MIAPVFQLPIVPPLIETAMGAAWLQMARKEGNTPEHLKPKTGVSIKKQKAIVRAIVKHGATWASKIADEVNDSKSKCSADLVRMVQAGVIVRRRAQPGEAPPYTQWIYELPEGAA